MGPSLGTFQPEEHRPTYGLTRNIDSFNPVVIAFKTWGDLVKKALSTRSLKTGLLYFIKPPSWSHDGSSQTVHQMRQPVSTVISPTPEGVKHARVGKPR